MHSVVVLAARPFYSNYKTIGDLDSPLLMPLNGHTLLDEILALYPLNHIIFVINDEASRTKKILEARSLTSTRINVIQVSFESLQSGPASTISKLITQKSFSFEHGVLVLFGDSLIEVDLNFESEVPIIIGAKTPNPERYSHFSCDENGKVIEYFDKGVYPPSQGNLYAEVGGYYLPFLPEPKELSLQEPLSQMADLLKAFPEVRFGQPSSWVDFGHWDAVASSFYSGKTRSFNKLHISQNSQYLTKSSSNSSKIREEFNFLTQIPETLKFHFPRVQLGIDDESYNIEFWPIKSLSEYFVFWNMPNSLWQKLVNKLVESLEQFSSVVRDPEEIPSDLLFDFYSRRMFDRLENIKGQVEHLLNQETLFLNGQKLMGFPLLKRKLVEELEKISKNATYSFVHGDFCFSNILIDPSTMTMKFIDPRGSFCGETLQGDLRYDVAKLRHSYHGLYDFIINDMFSLKQLGAVDFELEIILSSNYLDVFKFFDDALARFLGNEAHSQVKIIEGTLFLSMLPLHSDNQDHQIAFTLKALSILNRELYNADLL